MTIYVQLCMLTFFHWKKEYVFAPNKQNDLSHENFLDLNLHLFLFYSNFRLITGNRNFTGTRLPRQEDRNKNKRTKKKWWSLCFPCIK